MFNLTSSGLNLTPAAEDPGFNVSVKLLLNRVRVGILICHYKDAHREFHSSAVYRLGLECFIKSKC